jgi:hypothetical protein
MLCQISIPNPSDSARSWFMPEPYRGAIFAAEDPNLGYLALSKHILLPCNLNMLKMNSTHMQGGYTSKVSLL